MEKKITLTVSNEELGLISDSLWLFYMNPEEMENTEEEIQKAKKMCEKYAEIYIKNKAKSYTKEERCTLINKLILKIKEVTENKFLNDVILEIKNGKIYCNHNNICFLMRNEISASRGRVYQGGGTMFALLHDFAAWIRNGKYSNHKYGYGGLYGYSRWGYTKEQVQPILDFAKSIGYLYMDDYANYYAKR